MKVKVVVQSPSCVWLFATPLTAALPLLCPPYLPELLKFMSIELVMLSNCLIFCCPLLLLPSIFSSIRSFPVSWLLVSSGQSFGVSASASVFPVNIQSWFLLGLTDVILQSTGLNGLLQHHNCCFVAKLCPTLCDRVDCGLPGPSVHGISQARILEWVTIFFSRGSSRPRDLTTTTIRKHQFFSAQPSLWSNSHICACLLEKP